MLFRDPFVATKSYGSSGSSVGDSGEFWGIYQLPVRYKVEGQVGK
jgi:hypothetical protein